MRGFERGGAIFAAALRQRPSDISRSPTIEPARDQSPNRQGVVERFTRSQGQWPWEATAERAGREHAAIAQQRIEDAGEAPGEGDDGDLFAAARGDAQGAGPQVLRLRR